MKPFVKTIWDLLGQVQSLTLTATTKDQRNFFHNATAEGNVEVSRTGSRVFTFHEAGLWTSNDTLLSTYLTVNINQEDRSDN